MPPKIFICIDEKTRRKMLEQLTIIEMALQPLKEILLNKKIQVLIIDER